MGDEKTGPYKVVSKLTGYRENMKYSIVKQEKNDVFLREFIPDAGTGESARLACNLLNKHHKETTDDEAEGTGGRGLGDQGLPDDHT